MKLTFYSRSAFTLEEKGVSLLFDPWFTGNPKLPKAPEGIKPTAILVTHTHIDHLGDAIPISKATGAEILATPSIARFLQAEGAKSVKRHLGGTWKTEWGSVKVVQAWHDSPLGYGETYRYELGSCCGFVVNFFGKKIYYAGDTALFGDMALWAPVDISILPIDGLNNMDPEDAVRAVQFTQCKVAVPMHAEPGRELEQSKEFKALVESKTKARCVVLDTFESWNVDV